MKLNKTIQHYLESQSKRLAPNTIQRYTSVLERFCVWIQQDKDLSEVTEREIDLFQISLIEKLKPTTQLYYANILRTFFKFWVVRGKSDVVYQSIVGPRKNEHLPNFISIEKFELIKNDLTGTSYQDIAERLIFFMLWDTGMRVGELLSLDIADIKVNENCATIRTEKSKKLRIVVWSSETHKILLKYLGIRICLNQRPEPFQTRQGRQYDRRRVRLSARTVQRWCKKLETKLGFQINPHAFRHGKMHHIINNGGTRAHVQSIAGHSSIMSSEVYVRLNKQEQLRMQSRFLPTNNGLAEISDLVVGTNESTPLHRIRKVI